MNKTIPSKIALLLGAGLLTLAGCAPPPQRVAYNSQPPPRVEYAPPPPSGEYAPPHGEYAPPREGFVPPPRPGDRPPPREVIAPAPVRPETAAVAEDAYVYYPGYEVYYNTHRHQYTYREGGSWVSRPAPPRVAVDVLSAAPSVRLDFHDAPQAHHETVVRQYPKHWTPPGHPNERNEGRGERN